MQKTKIQWTNRSWNPVTGCDKISAGCDRCYAENLANRFPKLYPKKFKIDLRPERLDQPAKLKKPSKIFVNSMSDLFHKEIPKEFVDKVFEVMENVNRHTYMVLTKRSSLMRDYVNERYRDKAPPHNIWLGVSVENQIALSRIQHLRDTKAAIRFISFEPLIESVASDDLDLRDIHWAIVGGESGPGCRKMERDWVFRIKVACRQNRVAFFFKQWGGKNKSRLFDGYEYSEFPNCPVLAKVLERLPTDDWARLGAVTLCVEYAKREAAAGYDVETLANEVVESLIKISRWWSD